jgi:glutathione peroxidase
MNNLTKQGVNNIMRKFLFFLITFPVISIGACMDFYNQDLVTLQGKKFDLCKHQDKPIIFVNTASKCGFTNQFEDMENLYKENKDILLIVGFPSNDFNQEFKTDKEIQDFCKLTYAVEFPMMSQSSVIGDNANKVYKNLEKITGEVPLWNFYKFIVLPKAKSVHVFSSMTNPKSDEINKILQPYL